MEKIEIPQPVFMVSLEFQHLKDKIPLENALKEITKEDSSLVDKINFKNLQTYKFRKSKKIMKLVK